MSSEVEGVPSLIDNEQPQTALAVSIETTTEYRTDFPNDPPPSPSEAHGNTVGGILNFIYLTWTATKFIVDWPSETESSSQKLPASV